MLRTEQNGGKLDTDSVERGCSKNSGKTNGQGWVFRELWSPRVARLYFVTRVDDE